MDNLGNYCRLCADLKESSELSNMETYSEKCQEIVSKLSRFNIHVDFNNILPKTVCLECINSLERAFDFVTTVELAQEAFEDCDSSTLHLEKAEVVSDNDTIDKRNEDNYSIKPELKSENEPKKIEIEISGKIEVKEENKTPITKKGIDKTKTGIDKSETGVRQPKLLALSKTGFPKQRRLPKISKNVDLDTWHDYSWLCAYCNRYFLTPSELRIHSMQYHSSCNPYRCFDCKARGLHMDNFITHISKHRPVLTYICYKCSIKCETLKEMRIHRGTHKDTDYVCTGCNTYFFSKDELDDHKKTFYKTTASISSQSAEINESLKCVFCKKTSKSRMLLNRHLLIHTDRKRTHICETCGDSFYNKRELLQHLTKHSDSRPYQCEVCKSTFKMEQALKKHAAIHFEAKRFACEHCGKSFRRCKELVVHRAIHNDTRPYVCEHCKKSFRFRHLLIQHLRLHTGIKPYSCDICPLTFRNWSNFNKHTKDVHGVDNSKRKRTPDGLFAVDPKSKEIIYPDMDKVLQWKKKILAEKKKGRPRRNDTEREKSKTVVVSEH